MSSAPNLVYVFADEFRQRCLGFRNEDPVFTPCLDRFACESVELTNLISNFPVCSPYRGMLFSGRYPHHNGIYTNCHSNSAPFGCFLKQDEICLPDVLKRGGYETGYIGKWHMDPGSKEQLPYTEGYRPDGRIWDSYTTPERRHGFSFWYSYGCCDNHFHPHYWKNDAPIEQRIDVDEWSAEHEASVAVEYIENRDGTYREEGKPFALFVSMNPPHMPFSEVPEKYHAPYREKSEWELLNDPNCEEIPAAWDSVRGYFAAVTGVDSQFGRILDAIDRKGMKENTIVVFTSDHGELMGSHGLMGKDYWYRESVNVPFLLRYPEKNLRGRSDEIASIPDLFPTLAELMGLQDLVPESVEGKSLVPVLEGGKGDGFAYYGSDYRHTRGVISREYTYAVYRKRNGCEREYLYDNLADPFQLYNILPERPETAGKMREILEKMCRERDDPWISGEYPFLRD